MTDTPTCISTPLTDGPFVTGVTTRHISLSTGLEILGLNALTCYEMEQTHDTLFKEIDATTPRLPQLVPAVDALISTRPNTVIAVRTADCLPILITHESGAIAGIHAGKKSTELRILKNCLTYLKGLLNTDSGYTVWFGPHICAACYEVDPIAHTCFDLVAENTHQLQESLPQTGYRLFESPYCTSCDNGLFFSFRKENTQARFYSLIARRA